MELADWSVGVLPDGVKSVLPNPRDIVGEPRKIRDSFHTAPGYREIAVEYTCIPDSMYPWDPDVMKAIQVFAPDAVPLWVRWVFRTPQDYEDPHDVVYGRHALGRRVEHLESDMEPIRVTMPSMPCQGLTFKKPNRIWFIHEGDRDEKYVDLPGDFLPFDRSMYEKAEDAATAFRMSENEYKQYLRELIIEKPQEEARKRKAEHADDMEQREKDFHSYADKVMDSVSDVEISEFMRSAGNRR